MKMKLRFNCIFPTFYIGLSLSFEWGYHALGLGFWSISIDPSMDDLEKGKAL